MIRTIARLALGGVLCLGWAHTVLAAATQYFYDDLGRLTRVERPEGLVITYTYDAVGNRLSRTIIHDYDFDDVADAADNCPQGYNPSQGPGVFKERIIASDKERFAWIRPFDVAYVRGDLAAVGMYAMNDSGTLEAATSLTDPTMPSPGTGLYYLLKPGGGCAEPSWQSSIGSEPGRDAALP